LDMWILIYRTYTASEWYGYIRI